MLGFEQVPCYEGEYSISNQEFLSFISKYNISKYDDAVSMIYEQYSSNNSDSNMDLSNSDDDSFGSQTDSSDDTISSESEEDTNSSFSKKKSCLRKRRSVPATFRKSSEMSTVTRWYGVYIPSENALYLESPSTTLHSDCLTDILDIAECIQCFKVYIGIPRNRLDLVKRYLFAGFEISKKGQLQKQVQASSSHDIKGVPAQGHILLEYEL